MNLRTASLATVLLAAAVSSLPASANAQWRGEWGRGGFGVGLPLAPPYYGYGYAYAPNYYYGYVPGYSFANGPDYYYRRGIHPRNRWWHAEGWH